MDRRGKRIPELQKELQSAIVNGEPLPEGLLFLLLTGKVPTTTQVKALSETLAKRAALPAHVEKVLSALPTGAHPMTQLSTGWKYNTTIFTRISCAVHLPLTLAFALGIMALQSGSKFAQAYQSGIHRSQYWEPVYEDSMDLIAKLPALAALIYRRSFKNCSGIASDSSLDWVRPALANCELALCKEVMFDHHTDSLLVI